MPRLHKYVDGDGYYVLTNYRGAVVTYQLTGSGAQRLISAGVSAESSFGRGMLLDLYRTGDAYTRGGVEELSRRLGQIEMDFASDPDPESAFPACDGCGGISDLHLMLVDAVGGAAARLSCPDCRIAGKLPSMTSVPLGILSQHTLALLIEQKAVADLSPNVKTYEQLLAAELASRWEARRRERRVNQETLELGGDSGELHLS